MQMGRSMPTCPNCGEKGYFLMVFQKCDLCGKTKCAKCGENKFTFVKTHAKIDEAFDRVLKENKLPKYFPLEPKTDRPMGRMTFCTPACYFKFIEGLLMVPNCEISDEKDSQTGGIMVKYSYPDLNTEIKVITNDQEDVKRIGKLAVEAKNRQAHHEEVRSLIADIEACLDTGDTLNKAENFEKAAASFEEGIKLCNKVVKLEKEWGLDQDISGLKEQLVKRSQETQRKCKSERQSKVLIDQRTTTIEYHTENIAHKGDVTNIENSVLNRTNIGGKQQQPLAVCPYCGKELDLPKPPKFCPFCREQLQK